MFQGDKGQKLLELTKRFKGDDRFKLDPRFMEEDGDGEKESNGDGMSRSTYQLSGRHCGLLHPLHVYVAFLDVSRLCGGDGTFNEKRIVQAKRRVRMMRRSGS